MGLNILLANDDGINAQGIHELADAFRENLDAEIYVFAPEGQRSGASHGISIMKPIDVRKAHFEGAKEAYAISGTPADCIALGSRLLRKRGIKIDLVAAGINHGSNIGTDTVYSGTVGAAREGSIQGIPSMAVSVDSHEASEFVYACDLAVDTVRKTGGSWDSNVVININTPNLPKGKIRGVVYAPIGKREYDNDIQEIKSEGNVTTYIFGGEPVRYEGSVEKSDAIAIQNDYAVISLLKYDLAACETTDKLDEWRIGK